MGRAMTPVPGSRRVAGSPIELRGRADSARKLTPGPEPWEGRGQVQHNAAHRALDPDGELDQPHCAALARDRSEEHTSELQSLAYLVCRLLLEKKKRTTVQCAGLQAHDT